VPDEPEVSATEPEPIPATRAPGWPTFDSVREKIESRYETSIGAAELDAETPEGRDVDEAVRGEAARGRRSAGANP